MKSYPKAYLFLLLKRYFRFYNIKTSYYTGINTVFIEPTPHFAQVSLFFDDAESAVHVKKWPHQGRCNWCFNSNTSLKEFFETLLKHQVINEQQFNSYRQFAQSRQNRINRVSATHAPVYCYNVQKAGTGLYSFISCRNVSPARNRNANR